MTSNTGAGSAVGNAVCADRGDQLRAGAWDVDRTFLKSYKNRQSWAAIVTGVATVVLGDPKIDASTLRHSLQGYAAIRNCLILSQKADRQALELYTHRE